jgi:hypothetical protein
MFYFYFLITILLVIFVVWTVYWLHKLIKIKHDAQELYGKLLLLYMKRYELIDNFVNNQCLNEEERKVMETLLRLKDLARAERDYLKKIQLEHEISEVLKKFLDTNQQRESYFSGINNDIHDVVYKYNTLVDKMENIALKKRISVLMKVFNIKPLIKIEV